MGQTRFSVGTIFVATTKFAVASSEDADSMRPGQPALFTFVV